jgi:hypothetical protein
LPIGFVAANLPEQVGSTDSPGAAPPQPTVVTQGETGFSILVKVSSPEGWYSSYNHLVLDDGLCAPVRKDRGGNLVEGDPSSAIFTGSRHPEVSFEYGSSKEGPWKQTGYGYSVNACGQAFGAGQNDLIGDSQICRGYMRITAKMGLASSQKIIGCENIPFLGPNGFFPPQPNPVVTLNALQSPIPEEVEKTIPVGSFSSHTHSLFPTHELEP